MRLEALSFSWCVRKAGNRCQGIIWQLPALHASLSGTSPITHLRTETRHRGKVHSRQQIKVHSRQQIKGRGMPVGEGDGREKFTIHRRKKRYESLPCKGGRCATALHSSKGGAAPSGVVNPAPFYCSAGESTSLPRRLRSMSMLKNIEMVYELYKRPCSSKVVTTRGRMHAHEDRHACRCCSYGAAPLPTPVLFLTSFWPALQQIVPYCACLQGEARLTPCAMHAARCRLPASHPTG